MSNLINGGNFRSEAIRLLNEGKDMEAVYLCNRFRLTPDPLKPCCFDREKMIKLLKNI